MKARHPVACLQPKPYAPLQWLPVCHTLSSTTNLLSVALIRKVGSSPEVRPPRQILQGIDTILTGFRISPPRPLLTPVAREFRLWSPIFVSVRKPKEYEANLTLGRTESFLLKVNGRPHFLRGLLMSRAGPFPHIATVVLGESIRNWDLV